MKRVEPSIGSFDLTLDPAAVAAARDREKARETRASVTRWIWIVLFSVVLPGSLVAYGAYTGAIGGSPEDPGRVAKVLPVAGLFILYVSQVVAAIYIFSRSFAQGLVSLIVPGYFLIALRRNEAFYPVMFSWLLGAGALAAGTIMLS